MSQGEPAHADHDPYCLAMVLCDGVHRDPANGKFYMLGTFHAIKARTFPSANRFVVYFAVTDIIGRHELRVDLVKASTHIADDGEEPLFSHSTPIELNDPFQVVDAVIGVQCNIPEPGVYFVELFSGNLPLMSRRLVVLGPPEVNP